MPRHRVCHTPQIAVAEVALVHRPFHCRLPDGWHLPGLVWESGIYTDVRIDEEEKRVIRRRVLERVLAVFLCERISRVTSLRTTQLHPSYLALPTSSTFKAPRALG